MQYISTRGDQSPKRFCDILLAGLAPDGGLYLPEHYPQVTAATLDVWRSLPYNELAFEVLSLYVDDIPSADLKALCAKTYTQEVFGTEAIVPLTKLKDGFYIEGLSNGPTLAFKDMAMQLLGNLFEYELARRGETLNILGATSGDTGSAAEYAMRGKSGVRVFMTSPHDRMSPFQQAQMFSLLDDNIHNITIDGVFDDCQDIVKAVSSDLSFKTSMRIGTVNSINWARLMAQVVYYFAGYLQATQTSDQRVSFAVPSGNFGNVCAGHVARMMGLPIDKLVVATNENNVFALVCTVCAPALRRLKPPAHLWIFPKPAILSVLYLTLWDAMARLPSVCLTTVCAPQAASTSAPSLPLPQPQMTTVLSVVPAPMPTA